MLPDRDPGQRVGKDVVVFEDPKPLVVDEDASLTAVVNHVSSQSRVRAGMDTDHRQARTRDVAILELETALRDVDGIEPSAADDARARQRDRDRLLDRRVVSASPDEDRSLIALTRCLLSSGIARPALSGRRPLGARRLLALGTTLRSRGTSQAVAHPLRQLASERVLLTARRHIKIGSAQVIDREDWVVSAQLVFASQEALELAATLLARKERRGEDRDEQRDRAERAVDASLPVLSNSSRS